MKYDTQIQIGLGGMTHTVQVCATFVVDLPDINNGSKLDIEIVCAHAFVGGTWLSWPNFMDFLSGEQRTAVMTEMFEAWCAAKGMPVVEREAAHVARF